MRWVGGKAVIKRALTARAGRWRGGHTSCRPGILKKTKEETKWRGKKTEENMDP
jgi:hypothetical protein